MKGKKGGGVKEKKMARRKSKKWGKIGAPKSKKRRAWLSRLRRKR